MESTHNHPTPRLDNTKQDSGNAAVRVLAIIPAYNEAERIAIVIKGALKYLPVLVIDDGSSDETTAVARGNGADVLVQTPNQGKGAALRAGFQWAIDRGYQAVLTLDADGQHDPDDIPDFLSVYTTTEADLIIGSRDFSQIPPIRRLANTLGRVSFSWAVGQDIPDNQSGYRLISLRLMEALLSSQEQGFEFEVEMIKVAIQRGYPLEWVPIQTIYAGESSHISPFNHIKQFLRVVLRTRIGMRDTKN
ncbi:MAG: glycosyltransferase family 2 protein [Chloroflexota bacterium]|nr:glycosyltransferase family 2 protein [Chloroflexota bacterium]